MGARDLNYRFAVKSTLGWRIAVIGLILLVTACAATPPVQPEAVFQEQGLASYYARKFHGRRTASGERYDENAMTAAHRRLAFGAMVKVHNMENGRTVEVRINDRGPHRKGRIIDLSHAAARKLGMLKDGVVRVKISAAP
jgi:rare lipoprotein A